MTDRPGGLRLGLDILADRDIGDLRRWWEMCAPNGLSTIGVPDSPAISRDMFLMMDDCLAHSGTARAMTAVSNPVSRDVSVVASALASLAEQYPGRVDFGIGTGDSALWGTGLKTAKVDELREFIVALHGLLRGEHVDYRGRRFRLDWPDLPPAAADIGIYVACSGPRVLKMASEVADGAILHFGFSEDDVAYIDEIVEAGAANRRRPGAFDHCWHTTLLFSSSVEEGMRRSLGINPGWMTMSTMEGKRIPERLQAKLLEFTADYRNLSSEYDEDDREEALVRRAQELGLFDWLVERSPQLWGTGEDIAARLTELRARGMEHWLFFVPGPRVDLDAWITRFGSELVPALAD